jgi:hypothetical protein
VVNDDRAAQDLLTQVTEEWQQAGVLDVLCGLVREIWRADLGRYEPELGDDLMSLGVQASRNLSNLAVRELQDVPGVIAQHKMTLEVSYGGRVLHVGKAPSDASDWNVDHVDWADSDVRESAAAANSAAYQPIVGTLFEDLEPVFGQQVNPAALRHLHLTWQGFPDGGTRTWLGFPQLGLRPWYAVQLIDDATGSSALGDPTGPAPTAPLPTSPASEPDFDALNEPDVPVVRRRPGRRQLGA